MKTNNHLNVKTRHAVRGLASTLIQSLRRSISCLLVAGALGVWPGSVADAANLTVTNYNFETGGAFTCCAATPSGWTFVSGGGGFWGVFSAPGGFYPSAGTQSGPFAAYFRSTSDMRVKQVLSDTLQTNTTYTLTIAVGKRTTVNAGTYFFQLLAGGVPLATATGTAPASGTFSDVALVHATGATDAQLGQPLEIRIGNNGGGDHAVDFDNVRLTSAPVAILPTVTAGIVLAKGGIALNRRTNRWVQTNTLTNTTLSPIAGPLYLVLDGLSVTATLANGAGVSTNVAPLGSPYVQVLGSGGSLAPGASVSAILEFFNPTRSGILYTGRILSGGNVAP